MLFKHSGNLGDLVYALATVKKYHELKGTDIDLRVNVGAPMILYPGATHPNGNVMVNDSMYNMFVPLIKECSYIKSIKSYDINEPGTIVDLDMFRKLPIDFTMGNITTWYTDVLGVYPDQEIPWLDVKTKDEREVVLALSSRYRNQFLHHGFLKNYKVTVVGHPSEWTPELREQLGNAEYISVDNFLDMAKIIKSAKCFIGNPGLPFALAEAMKANRILEGPNGIADNVHPVGGKCAKVYIQQGLEHLVKTFVGR